MRPRTDSVVTRLGRLRLPARLGLLALCLASVTGCELEEVTIVDVQPVVVAEVYANLSEDGNEVRAYLHWTAGVDPTSLPGLGQSVVTVSRSDGFAATLLQNPLEDCLESFPDEEEDTGACFLAEEPDAALLGAGDTLHLDVSVPPDRLLVGATVVPAAFEISDLPGECRLDPDTLLPIRWTRSSGAWAYVNETSIRGLPAALAPEGIEAEEDPLYLLGLSIADNDTTIVFPSEFGVFNRFELDQDLAVRLQRGLPDGTVAEVTITAVDRNYINWARGGNFNPSGQVRVPSLSGDGTGVFGSTVHRGFAILSTDGSTPSGAPPCSTEPSP
jgi:hypothetical protein